MNTFKCDYIASTIASMVVTPFHMQHARFTTIFPNLTLPDHTSLYSYMSPKVFKACLKVLRKCHLYYLSQLITPTGLHLISWTAYQTAYIAQLADKRDHSLPHKWYLDIKANTTLPDSHDRLYDRYVCSPSTTSVIDLVSGVTTTQKNRHWLITLDENDGTSLRPSLSCDSTRLSSPVIHPSGSHYRFYTDSSLINLGSPEVLMGWSWVLIIHDTGYLNSVAIYADSTIQNWSSSIRAEAAAIYAALSVKGHDGNYWNEFADSLANSTHHSDDAILLPVADYTSSHNVRLVYDDVVCESNPRHLFKLYYQATFMKDFLILKRFQFTFCLCNRDDYVIDWNLTWFTLNFSLVHDASF
ncbi:hypothetical protein GLOIN_2v1783661 [Rhizophagus clarus]|uniref:RNase H type-1 domain-containing protein n=1 Tax=Rhizophagus clarus TaxID=94130 RepID=A0A8H3M4D4_9GLOM|nr:hypothetical protein GLOIN_2v1783661 [Rhizophagus clarus]